MAHFAVSAVGRDRPGIVAGITAGLLAVDGNVEDSRMANLGGHFAVMLLVAVPEGCGRERIEEALAGAREELELEALTVSRVSAEVIGPSGADHVITVYGSDHPGIVHAITAEIARAGVNITDLQTQLGGSEAEPLYVLMLEVELGPTPAEELERGLRQVADEARVEVELRPLDAEPL